MPAGVVRARSLVWASFPAFLLKGREKAQAGKPVPQWFEYVPCVDECPQIVTRASDVRRIRVSGTRLGNGRRIRDRVKGTQSVGQAVPAISPD